MAQKWIISDTHFSHANIVRFTKEDGTPIRPGFTDESTGEFVSFHEKDIAFHDECLIQRWNALIAPNDDVYHLGDFGNIEIKKRLNGKVRLILGNHDDRIQAHVLARSFKSVRSWRVFSTEFALPVVLCHYPLHKYVDIPVPRRLNVHGHIHEKVIKDSSGVPDPWYLNVCVEHTNCAPVSFDTLSDWIKKRKDTM